MEYPNVENLPYTLVNADSAQHLQTLPDRSIDLILTDPPYNLGKYSTGNIELSWRKDMNNDVADWDQITFNPADWLDEFTRVLKPSGNIFAFTSYNMLGRWHDAFDPVFDTFQFMVWHKTNPPPKVYRAGFLNSCELIVCMWNKGHTWNFSSQKEMHNYIEAPICMGNERLKNPHHPTQKPLRVLRHLIKIASNPGDVIYDPFMGVGSTGVAALELERQFIGVEISAEYFAAAEARMKTAEPLQMKDNKTILRDILVSELEKYAGEGVNALAFPVFDEQRQHYAIAIIDHPKRKQPADVIILARIAGDKIVIEEDMTDKKLVDALLQQGITREQIILAYDGEEAPTPQME